MTAWQGLNLAVAVGALTYLCHQLLPRPRLVHGRYPVWLCLTIIGLISAMLWLMIMAIMVAIL